MWIVEQTQHQAIVWQTDLKLSVKVQNSALCCTLIVCSMSLMHALYFYSIETPMSLPHWHCTLECCVPVLECIRKTQVSITAVWFFLSKPCSMSYSCFRAAPARFQQAKSASAETSTCHIPKKSTIQLIPVGHGHTKIGTVSTCRTQSSDSSMLWSTALSIPLSIHLGYLCWSWVTYMARQAVLQNQAVRSRGTSKI